MSESGGSGTRGQGSGTTALAADRLDGVAWPSGAIGSGDDVPWTRWASEHPVEASDAEDWLDAELAACSTDPDELRWTSRLPLPAPAGTRRDSSDRSPVARWLGRVLSPRAAAR